MPCHDIFDAQDISYKKEILSDNTLVVSIEASESTYWKKYTGDKGLNFGVNNFGKSAPYKDVFKYFKLDEENIIKKIKDNL